MSSALSALHFCRSFIQFHEAQYAEEADDLLILNLFD
jgi:hypothetical protein